MLALELHATQLPPVALLFDDSSQKNPGVHWYTHADVVAFQPTATALGSTTHSWQTCEGSSVGVQVERGMIVQM